MDALHRSGAGGHSDAGRDLDARRRRRYPATGIFVGVGRAVCDHRSALDRNDRCAGMGAPARPPDRNSQRGISRRYGHGVNVRPDLPIEYFDPPAVSIPAGHLIDPGA